MTNLKMPAKNRELFSLWVRIEKDRQVRVKKLFVGLCGVILLGVLYLTIFPFGQRADSSFDVALQNPAYANTHPVLLFDEGHYNSHKIQGKSAPFGKLLRNDGYEIRRNQGRLTAESLRGVAVLAIVNASGGSNPQLFGINLVPLRKGKREAPAFTAGEISTIRSWVREGGSLLLVADHYPFGTAAESLSAAFGVTMHCGFTEAPKKYSPENDAGAITFSRQNGLLMDHPVINGRSSAERLNVVMSFTGQSLDSTTGTPILKLPAETKEYVPPPPDFAEQPGGAAQGIVLEYGNGRVAVMGEAGMLTAQIEGGHRFGMNVPGVDNRQFVLNLMHWLSRLY